MGKISRLRLHVAPALREWRSEGIRPEELDLLYRGAGLRNDLSAVPSKEDSEDLGQPGKHAIPEQGGMRGKA